MSAKSLFDVVFSPISFIVGDKVGHAISGAFLAAIGVATGQMWLVGIGLSMVSGALGAGSHRLPSTNPSDRLFTAMVPTAPRKWLFGNTAGATDLRYQAYTGANQDYYEQIIAIASHEVNSIYEIWFDNEKAWDSTNGVASKFAGYLTVDTQILGSSTNGIAINGTWTSSCTLTGCAYIHLKFKLSNNSDTNQSPFASGVSSRVTVRAKGAKVYDPRLDSTVVGGSGTQRAATQSTWAWDDNGSRNPALQLLWFLIGWRINGKLAVGMGLPIARIDLPSFITAANTCDESITLNGGGTEPRYRGDGVLSEADDRRAVIETLCANMNAILRDAGGKLSLSVLKNDLSTPIASFTEDDVLGNEEWIQTNDLHQTFNIVRGRRIDPSDNALYQPVDFPEVSLTSLDGIDRIDTVEYMICQSNGQAQRLAKQRLQRGQYQGRYSFTGGPRWWQVTLGDVVQLSHQGLGWSNKLFRVVAQQIARTGETKIGLLEENAAIYAWSNNEVAPVVAGTPTIYDPNNSPIFQGIVTGKTAVGTNELKDVQFGNAWALSAGAVRATANANSGYASGLQPYYCELSPSTTVIVSAKSELVPVAPNQRIYFRINCQRGTTLGTGSRLNLAHEWVQSDGVTTTGTPVEGVQQTPSSLTAGAAPVSLYWSDVAPSGAAFVRIKPYTPALASSSGTFRVEAPVISKSDLGGPSEVGYGPATYTAKYDASGNALTGELPFDLNYKLYLGGVAQTSGVTWTYKVLVGTVNGFTLSSGAQAMTGTGTGTLTVSSIGADSCSVEITASSSNGSVAKETVSINKSYAAATGTGGSAGDSPSQTSGFTSFSTTTFTVISNTLTFTVPSGNTTATVSLNLSAKPVKSAGVDGSWTVEMKVQRSISGTWTDVGTVLSGTSTLTTDPDSGGFQIQSAASISGSRQSTSLTAATQYQFRIVARITSGTKQHDVTGSVSVTAP
jgi:Putative phage tail protein